MEVNDTLKFRSYGWKKDMSMKGDHIERLTQRNEQYYPPDNDGIIDEWKAVLDQQAQVE